MKTVIYDRYGSPEVLHTGEVEAPVQGDKEVLIRVRAASVNYGDLTARNFGNITPRSFNMPFIFWIIARLSFGPGKPRMKVLGNEFSGTVEKIGPKVSKFKEGQQVFGYTGEKMGAYAQFISLNEDGYLTVKPENMSFEEAAAAPMGGIMALNIMNKMKLQEGQKVLINGASGGIGSAALQLAKQKGTKVTGVCGASGLEYIRELGADEVIDYREEDFTLKDTKYDLVIDILGRSSFSRVKRVLTSEGVYLRVSFKFKQLIQMLVTSFSNGKKVVCTLASTKPKDLLTLRKLIEEGHFRTIVDRSFPMEEAAKAHERAEHEKKMGKVVITL